jgi:hypothetical protein
MAETIVVLIIAGIACTLSARWFYRTIAGRSEGCGCGESSPKQGSGCHHTGELDCCLHLSDE